jgi:hypothetical protein
VAARERRLLLQLQALQQQQPGVQIVFSDCGGDSCVGRVESGERTAIERFVAAARRAHPGMEVRVRQRLTAFNGRRFQADLTPAERS